MPFPGYASDALWFAEALPAGMEDSVSQGSRRVAAAVSALVAITFTVAGASAAGVPPTTAVPVLAQAPICLDSAGFGGVYCIWPERPRRPAVNTPAPPPPPPSQNQPPSVG